jgi:ABC-type spermidine/putrescine transport system permease subunit II
MIIAGTASVGALVLGSLAAYGLVRGNFLGRRILETNFIAPLIVPPVINAIALYIIYARVGLLGSFSGLIAAHIVIAAPYVVLLLSVAIRGFDQRIEQVAETLGASRGIILGYVLFPNLLPSLIAAWVLAFVVSFDELILTFFLFGTYDTLPKRMFVLLEQKVDPTITAVATMLIGLSCVSLLLIVRLLRNSGVLNPVER